LLCAWLEPGAEVRAVGRFEADPAPDARDTTYRGRVARRLRGTDAEPILLYGRGARAPGRGFMARPLPVLAALAALPWVVLGVGNHQHVTDVVAANCLRSGLCEIRLVWQTDRFAPAVQKVLRGTHFVA